MKKMFLAMKISFIVFTVLILGGFDLTSSSAQTNASCVDKGSVFTTKCECQGDSAKGCYIAPNSTGCGVCSKGSGGVEVEIGDL